MGKKIGLLGKAISQYRKAVSHAIVNAITWINLLVVLPASYKIKSLKLGKYPEEPAEIVRARMQEMKPIIIRDAVVKCSLLFILFFFIYLVYWLKRYYNVDLIGKLKDRIKKKDSGEM